ncbi:MAG: segregation/condensation protein A [Deltaproteobacteria bacterium]|nr:segregation/condensation protein A [Deltaproteobacteria bacterium]
MSFDEASGAGEDTPGTLKGAGADTPGTLKGMGADGELHGVLGDEEPSLIPEGGCYAVKLPVFEGPLDLLLHLIRQNEVEITDIPVVLIARQYLDYLEIMRELDLDVAGEYLVMAASLAHIKSRMLLPPADEEEEEEGIDPRAELVARLLEYQRYKEVAEDLSRRRLLGRDVFRVQRTGLEAPSEAERELEVGLFELIEAFRQVLENAPAGAQVHEVEIETVTVRDRMLTVMTILRGADSIEFTQVFLNADGRAPSRPVLVATFLAILELARLAALHLYQGVSDDGAPEGSIRLRPTVDDDPRGWDERISELM